MMKTIGSRQEGKDMMMKMAAADAETSGLERQRREAERKSVMFVRRRQVKATWTPLRLL